MRAGGYTVHQSLTAEAAAVLKLALGLARGRGHAQVTPLHVAFTLLGSSSSTSCAYGLLRRACARAHPGAAAAQCRALELCFNVALKRLPSTTAGSPPPSCSSVVHHPSPTLSNALVAALKRAQASQRRGCVDLQPPPPTAQQQLQPLLTIKVELDQLIVSILDDPSVSRVMREAGFSSAAVKTSLEEDSAMLLSLGHSHSSATSSPSSSPAPSMPLPSQMWPPQFPNHPNNYAEFKSHSHQCREDDDVNAILDVMSRKTKQGGRTNPAVVADCASAAEASVAELMRRMERGGGAVPDALRGAHVLRLHLSRVHVRLMARADVDAWAADLRRTVAACTNSTTTALLIYVGDMHWAVDDGAVRGPCCYSAAQHMAAALARLLGELRAAGRACWLVAAASYTTYMRCQRRGLDATWALQPVPVPGAAGELNLGLGLGPRAAASPKDGKAAKLAQFPLLDSEPKQEDGVAALCADCARNFEREASAARAKAQGTNLALSCFPGWPQADEPQTSHTDDLMGLKRKWSRLCQRVHLRHNQPDPVLCLSFETPTCHGTTSKINHQDVKTTLSLVLSEKSNGEVHCHSSEDLDLRIKVGELPFGDLKRKAESGRPPSESKRRRGTGGLDLNLCAEEEEDGADGSEDEPVPSDLTNDGEGSSGGVTDSLDSHD